MTKISRIFQDRLERQYQQHPTLQALRPMKEVNQAFRRFYTDAHGLPFYRFDLTTTQEHDQLAKSTDELCCWSHLVSLPVDNNGISKTHYDYQAYVGEYLGLQINNQNLISSFEKEFHPIVDYTGPEPNDDYMMGKSTDDYTGAIPKNNSAAADSK